MTRLLCILSLIAVLTPASAIGALERGQPIEVRILYDNSGSMYAGYGGPRSARPHSRAELGTHYVHQTPQFAGWLEDFVQRQSLVGAGTVGMWTFTSSHQFTPADIQEVHPVVPIARFRAADAISHFPDHSGDSTYLTETLTTFTRGFTGVVWLITDNIVENNAGAPDAGVQRFFETLARQPEFRAVHLFKWPVLENGQTTALAVYGIVVSPAEVAPATLEYYDGKFRALREAKRREGAPPEDLFPGRGYLKLRDLRIEPLTPKLQLVLEDGEEGTFREGQSVSLEVDGDIKSYLTQHAVTGGRYELAIDSPLQPEEWAQRDLGAQPLAPEAFDLFTDDIREAIPPEGARHIQARLRSEQPISFTPRNPVEWLRLAWSGAAVRYTGTARMSFSGIKVRLVPTRMAGIFGIDHATAIFDFQNVDALPQVRPTAVPVAFALKTGTSRTTLFLAILALVITLATVLGFLLARKRKFRITISNADDFVVALRPLASCDVVCDNKSVGRLSRGAASGYGFRPVRANEQLSVVPAEDPDSWYVKPVGGATRRLSIKAEDSQSKRRPLPAAARAAPPEPPARTRSVPPPPPPRRPPKTGRP